ncbi:MAG: shikimate kinase [Anaerolineae bacterium]
MAERTPYREYRPFRPRPQNNGTAPQVLLSPQDRNLILTGYTGPNQPALAGRVAERLKMRFVNVDAQIETRAGLAIDEIREVYGEQRLKMLEGEAIAESVLRRSMVLQINGRTLLNADHLPRIQETGPVICLVAALDAVLRRLHLTMGARYHNPQERAQALGYVKREWAIRKYDGVLELDTTYLSPDEIVDAIIALWRETQTR